MTAKEMFEKLGYKIVEDSCDGIKYRKKYTEITFYKIDGNKSVGAVDCDVIAVEHFITMEELKAINQQCSELGWLDE